MSEVSRKPIDLCWAFSLIVIGACTVIRFGAEILGFELPDLAVYLIGFTDLIALPVLAFTTVRKVKDGSRES